MMIEFIPYKGWINDLNNNKKISRMLNQPLKYTERFINVLLIIWKSKIFAILVSDKHEILIKNKCAVFSQIISNIIYYIKVLKTM